MVGFGVWDLLNVVSDTSFTWYVHNILGYNQYEILTGRHFTLPNLVPSFHL